MFVAIVQSGVRKQFAALLTALWQLNRVANSTYINSYSIHICILEMEMTLILAAAPLSAIPAITKP